MLEVEILMATQSLFKGMARLVIAPGEQGDFGILPHHAPMIIHLKKGIIFVHHSESAVDQIAIEKGWVNINNNHCSFLVEK